VRSRRLAATARRASAKEKAQLWPRLVAMYPGIKFKVVGEPEDLAAARQLAGEDRYQFQWWALSLVRAKPLGGQEGSRPSRASGRPESSVSSTVARGSLGSASRLIQIDGRPISEAGAMSWKRLAPT